MFVTGHTGFKGSWLCMMLSRMGAQVYGLSLPTEVSNPCLYNLAQISTKIHVDARGTIEDLTTIKQILNVSKPDIVFHLAAQPIVKEGFADPLGTFRTNIIGTANVLQACKEVKDIGAIVVITTDKVYEEQAWPWGYREIDPLGAADPYSTSKACSELIAKCYSTYKTGDIPVVTARAGNCIGFGDFSYRLVPMIAKWLSENTRPVIWDPSAIRPWQHVLDCLKAYLMIAEYIYPNGVGGTSWNVGPNDEDYWTCLDVAEEMCNYWPPYDIKPVTGKCPDTYPINIVLKLDSSKIRSLVGWKPQHSAYSAISAAGRGYQEYYAGDDPMAICEWELNDYGL